MIYFLQSTTGGTIKIGHSVDVDARRIQLEAHYGQPLALLATMPGGRPEERAIHERFSHLRYGQTEQFHPAADLLDFIGRPLFASAMPVVEVMQPLGATVRIDGEVAYLAKIVAAFRGQTLAEYLSEELRPIVASRLAEEIAKRGPKPPRR